MKAFYHKTGLGVLCGLLGKSRQAFYDHQWRSEEQALEEGVVLDTVRHLRKDMPALGGRKLFHLLQEEWERHGITMGRDHFFALLRQHELLISRRKKYVSTTQSKHWLRKYPNLMSGIKVEWGEQVWVSDITYIALTEGFAYLILITDAYSRKIVGYALSPSLNASFCVDVLRQALENRQFPQRSPMHHSDRGIQYCSKSYTDLLHGNGCLISMTQNGDPYENALAERVNGILKQEWQLDQTFASFEQAKQRIDHAVYHYNHSRPHASCDYLTPNEAHTKKGALKKRWKQKSKNKKPMPLFNINTVALLFPTPFVKPKQDLLLDCKALAGLSLNL